MSDNFDSTYEERWERFSYYLEKLGEENERLEQEIKEKRERRLARQQQSNTSKWKFDFKLFSKKAQTISPAEYKLEIEDKLNRALESYSSMREEMTRISNDLQRFRRECEKANNEIQNF